MMKSISSLVFVFVLGAALFAEAAPVPIESMTITGGTFSLWAEVVDDGEMNSSDGENFFFTTPYTFIGPNTDLVSGYIGDGGAGRPRQVPDPNRIVGFDFPDRDGDPNTNDLPVNTYTALTNLGAPSNNPSTNNSYYWTFTDDVSYAKGRHLLKVGALAEHLRTNKLTATNIRGTYTFPSIARFVAGTPSRFVGVLPGAQLERVRPNTLYGFYVQDDLRASERLTLVLASLFSLAVLALAATGLYGTLAQQVAERTRELGIRLALGANRAQLRAGVVWISIRLALTGIAIGSGVALTTWRLASASIPHLDAPNVSILAADGLVLLAVSALAAWIPARRASAVDPVVALRPD